MSSAANGMPSHGSSCGALPGGSPGSIHAVSNQPRSSSGSPRVDSSQSMIAASFGPSGANITLANW